MFRHDTEDDDTQDDAPGLTLEEQLAAERAARAAAEAERDRLSQRFDSFLREPRERREPERAKPLGPMPDPTVDLEAYQRWLAEKDARSQAEIERRLEKQREEISQTLTTQQRASMMWDRFKTKYPAHAERAQLVTVAYQTLVQAGRLSDDIEAGVDAVRDEMDRMVGVKLDQLGAPSREATRTAGTGGATPPVRRSRKTSSEDDDEIVTMHDSIMKQKKLYGLL